MEAVAVAETSNQTDLESEIARLLEENQAYEELFELHRQCLHRASVYWQQKTGRTDVWPDVTQLLIWLMDQVENKTN